jgi:cytochrome c553
MINHGNNTKPEILTCTHEEIAVAMAHGYAKMSGKPMAVMCHGVVGTQHAAGCFTCHGRSGQGGNYCGTTPTLAKTELPFEGFKQQLRDPVRVMPPSAETVVSDKEAADIYAFLQTLSGRRPARDFPILNN